MSEQSYEPAAHYDHVMDAWRLLLGEELHYGVFAKGNESLAAATAALTHRMIEAARLDAGLEVLDVGCGTGAPACQLAADYGVQVTGITTSEAGVGAGRALADARELTERVHFEVRDGTDNRFPDASFDRVWVLEASHLMRDREGLVSESARVLRPGGRFVLCDIIRRREIPFSEVRARREEFMTLRAAFGDARMDPLEFYRELLGRHGMRVDHAEDLTEVTRPTFDRWRGNADAHAAQVAAAIGEDGLDAFRRSCEILAAFWDDGTFGYGLVSAEKSS